MKRALVFMLLAACGRSELYRYTADASDSGLPDAGCPECAEVVASLMGQRWELPCLQPWPAGPEYVCVSGPDTTSSVRLQGVTSARYEVRLRVRGVVETKEYVGGVGDGGAVVLGGQPVNDAWNIYRLDISSPMQRWHLNRGPTGEYLCRAIDQRFTVEARGGATFTLFASTVDSERTEILNRDADGGAIVVPGIPPFPAAFDGQFLQLDVEGVRRIF